MTMILLVPGQVGLPSYTISQRKSRSDFEFILDKEVVLPVDGIAAWLTEADTKLIERTQQKIGHRVAASDAAERHAAGLRKFTNEGEINFVNLKTPFRCVRTMNPAHRVA